MSVVIIVKVSEGLVLGADSASTLQGQVKRPDGQVQGGVLKTFMNARKLLQIGDFPIGVLTWGTAYIGSRTIESLVREWEYNEHWQNREIYYKKNKEDEEPNFQVKKCAEGLFQHISNSYVEEFGNDIVEGKPVVGVIVAGYSERGFFPEIWRFIFPYDLKGNVHDQRPDVNGKPDFGASWYGMTDAIVRFHFGRDDGAVKIISEKYNIDKDELRESLNPLQYHIPFPVMPLQDAIDYARFMLNIAVGRFRFVIGTELCGGEIEIAAVTQKEFEWISKKKFSL